MKDSETPFGDGAIVAFVPQDVFDDYLQIRIKVAEQGIQEEMEKENRDKIEELKKKLAMATGTAEQAELDKHRLKIIDDIFTLKCPRCKLAFLDYDNCSAITCAGCKCGFCSYCLEDCGLDAHQHFYKNKSACPKEGGPLFSDHGKWQGYQSKRKGRLLCEYLSTVPEELRKKVADLCAPDAKDLGVQMPEDLSGPALNPEAYGYTRLKIHVPRKLRGRLKKAESLLKDGVELKMPDAKAKVQVSSDSKPCVLARKQPGKDAKVKALAANLPNGHEVEINDQWVECQCPKLKITRGFVKEKHVVGRALPGGMVTLREASGHGAVLVRKEPKQEEGENSIRFLDDGSEVKVLQSWVECTWVMLAEGHGFIEAANVPEDDVLLVGKAEACWAAAAALEKELGVELMAEAKGGGGVGAKAKAKGKAKAEPRGRGRGRGRG